MAVTLLTATPDGCEDSSALAIGLYAASYDGPALQPTTRVYLPPPLLLPSRIPFVLASSAVAQQSSRRLPKLPGHASIRSPDGLGDPAW